MSNDYFNHSSTLGSFTKVKASAMNSIFNAIVLGFSYLPTLAQFRGGTTNLGPDTGSANAHSVTRTFIATALADGMKVRFKSANTNAAGAATLNVDSFGAKSLVLIDGTNPAAGDLTAGDYIEAVYDLTNDRWVITSAVRSSL